MRDSYLSIFGSKLARMHAGDLAAGVLTEEKATGWFGTEGNGKDTLGVDLLTTCCQLGTPKLHAPKLGATRDAATMPLKDAQS